MKLKATETAMISKYIDSPAFLLARVCVCHFGREARRTALMWGLKWPQTEAPNKLEVQNERAAQRT